jgi:iron complex outermembrane receptor protein
MKTRCLLLTAAGLGALLTSAASAQDVAGVVVTGAPYAVSLDSATTSVNIVSRAQLDVAPPVGIGDLLAGQPGLRSSAFGPGASRPIIRGLSGPRVMILQNGTGQVDASSISPDHAVASEPSEAQRIEVLRGPAALAYGGSAIGGVVNIIDDRIPTARVDGFTGRASGSYDSDNDGKALSGALKAGLGNFVLAIDAAKRKSSDYRVDSDPVSARLAASEGLIPLHDRRVKNSDVLVDAQGAGVSYVGDDGYIGVALKKNSTVYGVPYAQVRQVGPVDPDAEGPVVIHLHQTRYDFRGEHSLDVGPFEKIRFSVGYADYEHAEVERATGEVGTRFLSNGTEGRVELVQSDRDGWQGAVGLQGLTRDFSAIGDEAFIPPVNIHETGVFALQRLDKDIWGVEGGLRLDRRGLNAALRGRPTSNVAASRGLNWATAENHPDFTNVSASGAVFVRPVENLFLSVSLSRNARAPTEFELFADGPHGGTGVYEIGDSTLKSEKVVTVEGAARWTAVRGKAEFHLFTAKYNGFIEESFSGERVGNDGVLDPDGELPVVRFSQSGARFYGSELAGSYDLWTQGAKTLSLEGSADYVHGTAKGSPIARVPPYAFTVGLNWTSPVFEAKAEVHHVGGQDRVTAFELPTDAYTLINASFSAKPFVDKGARLFVDADNLTGEEAREHASFLKDVAPMPGRSIRAGFAYSF